MIYIYKSLFIAPHILTPYFSNIFDSLFFTNIPTS